MYKPYSLIKRDHQNFLAGVHPQCEFMMIMKVQMVYSIDEEKREAGKIH